MFFGMLGDSLIVWVRSKWCIATRRYSGQKSSANEKQSLAAAGQEVVLRAQKRGPR